MFIQNNFFKKSVLDTWITECIAWISIKWMNIGKSEKKANTIKIYLNNPCNPILGMYKKLLKSNQKYAHTTKNWLRQTSGFTSVEPQHHKIWIWETKQAKVIHTSNSERNYMFIPLENRQGNTMSRTYTPDVNAEESKGIRPNFDLIFCLVISKPWSIMPERSVWLYIEASC